MISFFILSRFALALFYTPPADTGYRPQISVIIACKNEEDSIKRTIDFIYESDYAADKMEVIAVNDGSTDGTLAQMRLAARSHPNLRVFHFKKNLGNAMPWR
jgi:hyaluronan synthase